MRLKTRVQERRKWKIVIRILRMISIAVLVFMVIIMAIVVWWLVVVVVISLL